MPPYLTVATYVPSPEDALPGLLARFSGLLDQLGGQGRDVRAWLAEIDWPPHGDDSGSALHPDAQLAGIEAAGRPLLVLPSVNLWTEATIPGLRGHWLSLELAFEAESDTQHLGTAGCFDPQWAEKHNYVRGVERAMWRVVLELHKAVGDRPIWLCDETVEGDSWEALETGRGNLWSFELALVPASYAEHFSDPPSQFVQAILPVGLALAERARWLIPPWEETGEETETRLG